MIFDLRIFWKEKEEERKERSQVRRNDMT
jgi:hypothetical protein